MCITLMAKMGWNVIFCEEEFARGNLVQASEKKTTTQIFVTGLATDHRGDVSSG